MAKPDYVSDGKKNTPIPNLTRDVNGKPQVAQGNAGAVLGELIDRLEAWVGDMEAWGREVRLDIVRLEAAAGLPEGDPGDPPPRPWP